MAGQACRVIIACNGRCRPQHLRINNAWPHGCRRRGDTMPTGKPTGFREDLLDTELAAAEPPTTPPPKPPPGRHEPPPPLRSAPCCADASGPTGAEAPEGTRVHPRDEREPPLSPMPTPLPTSLGDTWTHTSREEDSRANASVSSPGAASESVAPARAAPYPGRRLDLIACTRRISAGSTLDQWSTPSNQWPPALRSHWSVRVPCGQAMLDALKLSCKQCNAPSREPSNALPLPKRSNP